MAATFVSSQTLSITSFSSFSSFTSASSSSFSLVGLRFSALGSTKCRNFVGVSYRSRCYLKATGSKRPLTVTANAVGQAAETSIADGVVVEVTQETFWPVLEAAGDRLVVLDLYTQWCGPCKIMYPKIVELSRKYTDVLFLKLDCNQENKALAKSLGVSVVPTFKLFKHRKEIGEVKGAKFDELLRSIEKATAL